MPSLPGLTGTPLRDFSGGPNLRDAAPELAANECVDAYNVTFDERGGVSSRLGSAKYNASVYQAALVQNVFDWKAGNTVIVQCGAKLYKGTSTVANKTFTTAARVGFAEHAGYLMVVHPVDGLFSSTDGVTFTAVADPDAPKGDVLAVWQNKLYVAGLTSRVTWSDAGNPLSWTSTSFVELREKDDETIVALEGASGTDIAGRQGLLAFKNESAYRIFNASTGEYETIDATTGAAGALAVESWQGKTYTISRRGICATDGIGPLVEQSARFQPLWQASEINFAQQALWCAGRLNNRLHFSLTRAGATANNLALEFHPEQGWIAPGSNAASCYATFTDNTETLYAGSPSVNGRVYQLYTGGTDDGTGIAYRFQTRWLEPNRGFQAHVWQIRLHGRGQGTMTVLTDFAAGGGTTYPFVFTTASPVYDVAVYDTAIYDDTLLQQTLAAFSVGLCRQVSVKFTGTATATVSGPVLLGAGTGPTLGEWSLAGLDLLHTPLGIS